MQFMSTIAGKIDAKGRVSVPSVFRATIAAQNGGEAGMQAIFVYPALDMAAIEGGGPRFLTKIATMLEAVDPFSDERAALDMSFMGASHQLLFDTDGRVSLPQDLLDHAGIEKSLYFVGLGDKFQIWQPERFAEYRDKARAMARDKRKVLRPPRRDAGGD